MKRFSLVGIFLIISFYIIAQNGTPTYTKNYYTDALGVNTDKLESEGNLLFIPAQRGKPSATIKIGPWKFYHPNGVLLSQVEYNKDGLATGHTIFFAETGVKAEEGEFKLGKETGVWKTYYDGKLKTQSEFINGLLNGDYTEFYSETGVRREKGQYQNNFQVGRWLLFDANGLQNGEVNYNQVGKKHGLWKYTLEGTQVSTSGNYKEDERVGIWTVQNKAGKIIQTVDFDNGVSSNYYESGKLLSELVFFKAPNNRIGLRHFLLQNENGNKKLEGDFDERITYKPEGVFQYVKPKGIWNSYWDNGELATTYDSRYGSINVIKTQFDEKYLYPNGKGAFGKGEKVLKELTFFKKSDTLMIEMKDLLALDPFSSLTLSYVGPKINLGGFTRRGVWENYDSLGNIETKVNYNEKTNAIVGAYTAYYKNGKMRSSGEYDNMGKRTGNWTFYYENGNKAEESPYDNGKKTGLVIEYFINGNIKQKGAFVDDKRVGLHELFHPNGKPLGTENYKAGVFVNFGDFYTEDGSVSMQQGTVSIVKYFDNTKKLETAKYTNGKLNGYYLSFFENGNKKFEANYQNGVLQGDYQFYFEAGGVFEKGTYVNGKTESLILNYHPNGMLLGKSYFSSGTLQKLDSFFDDKGNSIMSNGTGTYLAYNIKGKVTVKMTYLDYCRNGKAQWFYDNGQMMQEAVYKYSDAHKPTGLRWEVLSSFSPDGNPRDPGTLSKGNGTWITYDDAGKKTVTTYLNGLPKN